MGFTYKNRREKVYYLHVGPKRGGGLQHYLSTKAEGEVAEAVPEGFEIYETVNAQVFLRRKKPALIMDSELACVQGRLSKFRPDWRYKSEAKDKAIIIYENPQDYQRMAEESPFFLSKARLEEISIMFAHYIPIMRFVLLDKSARIYEPQRYCFRGPKEDWIPIGSDGKIKTLVARYLKHLGKDSLFELY